MERWNGALEFLLLVSQSCLEIHECKVFFVHMILLSTDMLQIFNIHLLLLCMFSLMQMSILSADSSKVGSQTVFERKMQDKLEQLKQSGKVFCWDEYPSVYELLPVHDVFIGKFASIPLSAGHHPCLLFYHGMSQWQVGPGATSHWDIQCKNSKLGFDPLVCLQSPIYYNTKC